VAPAIRFEGPHKTCDVPLDDAHALATELRRLDGRLYPDALMVAAWLDAVADDESRVTDQFKPGERGALDRALEGMAVSDEITEPLRCLWDEVRTSLADE